MEQPASREAQGSRAHEGDAWGRELDEHDLRDADLQRSGGHRRGDVRPDERGHLVARCDVVRDGPGDDAVAQPAPARTRGGDHEGGRRATAAHADRNCGDYQRVLGEGAGEARDGEGHLGSAVDADGEARVRENVRAGQAPADSRSQVGTIRQGDGHDSAQIRVQNTCCMFSIYQLNVRCNTIQLRMQLFFVI